MPWGSWSYPETQQPQPQAAPQISPEMIATLRRHLGLDDATQSMTHQPEQPNPSAPAVDALAGRFQAPDLTPAHLPGTEPKDYLRELYRNPDILARGVEQAGNFNFVGSIGGKPPPFDPNAYGKSKYTYRPGGNENAPGGGRGTPQEDVDASVATLNDFFTPLVKRDQLKVIEGGKTGGLGDFITAYHGSPHDFDRFDLSKIGTGEGAQAYGHGLYFAEREGVAKEYQQQVKDMAMLNRNNKRMGDLAKEMDKYAKPGKWREYSDPRGDAAAAEYDRLMDEKMKPGKMYQVAIKAPPEHFLDWDKPLSEQSPKVQSALEPFRQAVMKDRQTNNPGLGDVTHTGELIAGAPDQAAMSKSLREAGIPGIKYLDQGSRAQPIPARSPAENLAINAWQNDPQKTIRSIRANHSGQNAQDAIKLIEGGWKPPETPAPPKQTSNYVVFDDKLIDILKKYGIAGVAALPAMNAYHYQDKGN